MLSNQVLQRTISEIENIAGGSCSVWAMDGHRIVQAGTESMNAGERIQAFLEEIKKKRSFRDSKKSAQDTPSSLCVMRRNLLTY